MNDDPFWSAIRKWTGLTDEQLARFEAASNHPYECRCPLCVEWWSLVPPENEEEEMVKLYRKKQMIEVERWTPGIDMEGVSVSDADKANGSPKTGDVIARNSDGDPKDRWLIAQATFERTYEPF